MPPKTELISWQDSPETGNHDKQSIYVYLILPQSNPWNKESWRELRWPYKKVKVIFKTGKNKEQRKN
jgi:hypothetical protein